MQRNVRKAARLKEHNGETRAAYCSERTIGRCTSPGHPKAARGRHLPQWEHISTKFTAVTTAAPGGGPFPTAPAIIKRCKTGGQPKELQALGEPTLEPGNWTRASRMQGARRLTATIQEGTTKWTCKKPSLGHYREIY